MGQSCSEAKGTLTEQRCCSQRRGERAARWAPLQQGRCSASHSNAKPALLPNPNHPVKTSQWMQLLLSENHLQTAIN